MKTQISEAKKDKTHLLAGVQVAAKYKLLTVNSEQKEDLFQNILSITQIDIRINKRFDNPVKPRE